MDAAVLLGVEVPPQVEPAGEAGAAPLRSQPRRAGHAPGDTSHVNHVWVQDGRIYASGTKMPALWRIDGERLGRYARVPFGTHNTRPFRDGVLFNHTRTDRIAYARP